jgi:hypothetical protein
MKGLGTPGTFFMFSGITYLGGIIFLFLLKETKGVPADQLAKLYLPKGAKD